MSSFRLIAKNLLSVFTSNVIQTLVTFITPLLFLRLYGKLIFADWLVLASAVSYLGNLNFGLQTFVNQDLTVRYNRGERDTFHVQQSTALRALLTIAVGAAIVCGLVIYALPVERLLQLREGHGLMPHWQASTALYFVALQVLTGSLLYGYFGGAFMAVGLAHRGNNWNNAQRFGNAVLLWLLLLARQPIWVLAVAQWIMYMVLLVGLLIDLRLKAPEIFPTLRHWDGTLFRSMLHPSGHFALMFLSNFITYEFPNILLNRIAGADAVDVFNLGRRIFSSGRQLLTGITQSIGPEITRIFGQEDWPRLYRLYDYSERIIFALIAVINVPLFVFSPILLHLWLHKSGEGLFNLHAYLLLAITATVICIKEHKMQFQVSTNSHIQFSRVMFSSYVAMTLVSIATIHFYGLMGWLFTWLVTEVVQVVSIVHLNRKLFSSYERLSLGYIAKLSALCIAGFAVGYVLLVRQDAVNASLPHRLGANFLEVAILIVAAWYLFHLNQLSGYMKQKIQGRFRPAA
jgi:O-antigen/teichoic acid export membrane protein